MWWLETPENYEIVVLGQLWQDTNLRKNQRYNNSNMWWIKEPENYEIVILNQLWQMKAIYSKKPQERNSLK